MILVNCTENPALFIGGPLFSLLIFGINENTVFFNTEIKWLLFFVFD